MEIELSDIPAQATQISGGGVSFPDMTCNAYCVSPLYFHPFTWTRTNICHPTLQGRRTASHDRQACCHDGNMSSLPCVKLTVMLPPRCV
ncbi:hypothetical protein TCDM_10862 [Trypanosoma cruzi Dm28c]|uniref:Uncharacterized protein n=1 Tax=Trypanosoma cruzi Dm28c TaxID=1416333 RepID=V5BB09_TRYCR|nr:hypothetical protein TCDM_10862 [Trypanosoma cruzi Dm28c]